MSDFQTVVVGTDGSESSLRAVERAGELAAKLGATLIVATAYVPAADHSEGGSYHESGDARVYAQLEIAKERASAAGATKIQERAIPGAPVEVLIDLATEVDADLLVVGSVGINTIAGRLLGSVPTSVLRQSKVDVLVVHTTD
ncbi:MAG TPA: universal stress protein [Mycobacterium sp.]|nr:universal stress protein [Mycobacterium sp.]